ncbi:MAG: hypothetical protein ACFB13_05615 [Kiloniellaceae bacterium]
MIDDRISYGTSGRYPQVLEACVYCFAFAVVAALGAVNLYYPFGPDEAIVYHGAKLMDQGAIYYADYWDNKQPGLYWFYLLAGRLFGFSEFGIHLLELLWMLAFAVVLMVTLRGAFRQRWLSALVPVATIGVYYGFAGESELTQLEFIVSLPLFLLALCLVWAHRHPTAMPALYLASGLLAGVVVAFKLLLAPLCVALWLVALAYHLKAHRPGLVVLVLRAVVPASAGVAIVLGAIVLLYVRWGHLEDLLWTAFVYPTRALEYAPKASKTRLVTAAAFFFSLFAPWAFFALCGVIQWVRRHRDLLSALMFTWLVGAIVLFLVQRVSWWQYHTLLFLFPAGFFAVLGIDRLSEWFGGVDARSVVRHAALAGVLALTTTASLGEPFLRKAQPLLSSVFITGRSIEDYQSQVGVTDRYGHLRRGVDFLWSPDALPGPIYVVGNAMVYEFANRPAAHRTGGSSWEFYLPEQIDDLLKSLDEQQAPYVFVGPADRKIFRLRPQIAHYLDEHYFHLRTDLSGSWYQRRGLVETQPDPAPTPGSGPNPGSAPDPQG